MAEARLLRGPRCRPRRRRRRSSSPPTGSSRSSYHPDRNPGRPGRRGEVQGGVRGLRRALRPGEARALRPLRPRGRRRSGAPGLRPGFDPSVFGDFSDLFGDLFGFSGSAAGPRARPAATSSTGWRSPSGTRPSASRRRSSISRLESVRRPARARGAEPGSPPRTCPTCGGRGRQRFSQGFLTVTRPCATVRGRRDGSSTSPAGSAAGKGGAAGTRKLDDPHPGRRRDGLAPAADRRGGRGTQRRPGRRSLRRADGAPQDEVFEREGDDVVLRLDLPFPTLVLGGEVSVPTLEGDGEDHDRRRARRPGTRDPPPRAGVRPPRRRGRGDLVVRVGVRGPGEALRRRRRSSCARTRSSIGAPVGGKSVLDKAKKIFS